MTPQRLLGVFLLLLAVVVLFWPTDGPGSLRTLPAADPTASAEGAPMVAPVVRDATTAAAPAEGEPATAEREALPRHDDAARDRAIEIVVVGPNGEPVPHAELLWADELALQKAMQARERSRAGEGPPEPKRFADRLRALGESAVCDARGVVNLRIAGANLALYAHLDSLSGEDSVVLTADATSHRLQLRHADHLVCRAMFDDGEPAVDVPIVLVWQRQPIPGRDGDPTLHCGATDEDGRVMVDGWSRAVRHVMGEGAPEWVVAKAGPYVLGAGAAFVDVFAAGGEVTLRVPRHAPLRVLATDAAGEPLDWSRLRLRLVGVGDPLGIEAQLTNGATEVLAVAGSRATWRLPAGRASHGEGSVAVPWEATASPVQLRCQDVVRVSGRVEPPGASIELELPSEVRPSWTLSVPASADGAFSLPISRHDRALQFTVSARGERAMVVVPPLDADRVDVGVVNCGAGLAPGPFAWLDVRDEQARPLANVIVTASVDGAMLPCRVERPGAEVELHLPNDLAAVAVHVAANGFAPEQLSLRRGDRRRVVMATVSEFVVPVRLAEGVDPAHVWVHVPQRWSETQVNWVIAGTWHPLEPHGSGYSVRLTGVARQRSRIELWSLVPPTLVAETEAAFGDEELALDATRLRSVSVEVEAKSVIGVEGPREYCVVAASGWAEQQRLRLVRLPFGAARWTVLADDGEVLVAAFGQEPVRVGVAAAVPDVPLRVGLRALDAAGVLGIAGATRIVSVGPSVRGGLGCTVFAGTNLPDLRPTKLSDLAREVLLPVDFMVEIDGEPRLARRHADGWRVE